LNAQYPAAFKVYKLHCKENSKLPGTCLLIPPQPEDYRPASAEEDQPETRQKRRKITTKTPAPVHWIGCLFTSHSYGKPTKFKAGKDSPEKILSNTKAALKDLREQVEALDAAQPGPVQRGLTERGKERSRTIEEDSNEDNAADEDRGKKRMRLDVELGPLYACKFNSGSFGVEWKDTRALIEAVFEGSNRVMHVVSPPS
jgi:ADP-ribose 1''-phosphate phosphatase